jgi:hypothetical protein
MRKKLVVASLLLLIVMSTFFFMRTGNQDSDYEKMTGSNALHINAAAPPSTDDTGANQKDQLSPIVGSASSFEQADDLYALDGNLLASKSADSLWLRSKIANYCAPYGLNPVGFTADTEILAQHAKAANPEAIKTARTRIAHRCRGFNIPGAAENFKRNTLLAHKVRAAKAGNLAAEAALLSDNSPLSANPAYIKELIDRVIESKDPDAFLSLSTAMGVRASGEERFFGAFSGTENASLAWQLAACRTGLDCSNSGAIMTMYCVNGGMCTTDANLESLFFNHLVSPAQARDIREITSQILSQGKNNR